MFDGLPQTGVSTVDDFAEVPEDRLSEGGGLLDVLVDAGISVGHGDRAGEGWRECGSGPNNL